MQVASLRHNMTSSLAGDPQHTMFTRLDADHNTCQLQSAVAAKRLSPAACDRITESMSEYLEIPSQLLAHVGKRYWEKETTKRLTHDIQREANNEAHLEKLVKEIESKDASKQKKFDKVLQQLKEKRASLAQDLTKDLNEMEKATGSFLIKPVYSSRGQFKTQGIVFPLRRPLPVCQLEKEHQVAASDTGPRSSRSLVSHLVASQRGVYRGNRATAGKGACWVWVGCFLCHLN